MGSASDRLYAVAQKVQLGQLDTEMGYSAIFLVLIPMAVAYTISTSGALAKAQACGDKVDDNNKKYLLHSLVVGLTIPAAFVISKFVQKDVAAWMVLYGGMALAGTAIAMQVLEKCQGNDTEKMYNGYYLVGFSLVILLGLVQFFLM
jgi:hypothetical protein